MTTHGGVRYAFYIAGSLHRYGTITSRSEPAAGYQENKRIVQSDAEQR